MLTIKQIRDLFYSLMNTSRSQERVAEAEANILKIFEKCSLLTYED